MKGWILAAVGLCGLGLTGCMGADASTTSERRQIEQGVSAIVANQPVPDLGGYSLERRIVIETYLARNRTVATYAYAFTLDGRVVEICPSIGYPIPYSTQLTNPQKVAYDNYHDAPVISQAEPNGLFPPGDAAATLIQCANEDGSVTPTYWEPNVFAQPYRVKADIVLERISEPTFTVNPKAQPAP